MGSAPDRNRRDARAVSESVFHAIRVWWLYSRPWWVRANFQRVSVMQNNCFLYLGPLTFSWDHEFSDYVPGEGFAWLPQPRRAFRIWFRVFTKLLEITDRRDGTPLRVLS